MVSIGVQKLLSQMWSHLDSLIAHSTAPSAGATCSASGGASSSQSLPCSCCLVVVFDVAWIDLHILTQPFLGVFVRSFSSDQTLLPEPRSDIFQGLLFL